MEQITTKTDSYIVSKCPFCHGTGIATYVDMDKVPDYTSMVTGDKTWKKHKEVGACPEKCQIVN